jgi:hypothetical protein
MSDPLAQAQEAADLARRAFDAGDLVTGIAALTLAAQLVQLARIWESILAGGSL